MSGLERSPTKRCCRNLDVRSCSYLRPYFCTVSKATPLFVVNAATPELKHAVISIASGMTMSVLCGVCSMHSRDNFFLRTKLWTNQAIALFVSLRHPGIV
jgi:hypothetical protein